MTTETAHSLFSDPSNNALLRRFSLELGLLPQDSVSPPGFLINLSQIVELMIANPARFDEFASVNIEWIGRHFIDEIGKFFGVEMGRRQALLRSIFTAAYRFLCELEFTQPAEPSIEVRKVMNFVHDNLEAFEGTDRQQLVYAAYTMPAQVSKKLIGHPAVVEFRRFSETVEASRKLKEQWDGDLERRQSLLQGLADNVKRVTSEYNFVGLVSGFQALKRIKERERMASFGSLLVLGFLLLGVPSLQFGVALWRIAELEKYRATAMYLLPSLLAIELILVYIFRVVLAQFRSVKAQLLQLDLRIALCQFVESYSEYVSRIRENDSAALVKFESLIFSGLVADESGIPSTFDGIEQVANLIRSLRGESKS